MWVIGKGIEWQGRISARPWQTALLAATAPPAFGARWPTAGRGPCLAYAIPFGHRRQSRPYHVAAGTLPGEEASRGRPVELGGKDAPALDGTDPAHKDEVQTGRQVCDVVLRIDKAEPRVTPEAQHLQVNGMNQAGRVGHVCASRLSSRPSGTDESTEAKLWASNVYVLAQAKLAAHFVPSCGNPKVVIVVERRNGQHATRHVSHQGGVTIPRQDSGVSSEDKAGYDKVSDHAAHRVPDGNDKNISGRHHPKSPEECGAGVTHPRTPPTRCAFR